MVVLASIIYIERLLHIFIIKLNNKPPSSLNPLLVWRVRKGCGQWEHTCSIINHWEPFNVGLCHVILMASFYFFLITSLFSEFVRCSMLFYILSDPVLESVKFSIQAWFILLEFSIWSIGFYSLNHLCLMSKHTHIHIHIYTHTHMLIRCLENTYTSTFVLYLSVCISVHIYIWDSRTHIYTDIFYIHRLHIVTSNSNPISQSGF